MGDIYRVDYDTVGGGGDIFTATGSKTLSSSALTVDTGLGNNLRIFKFSGVATNSYGSDMKFAGEWDATDPTTIMSAGVYSSNGGLVTAFNTSDSRALGIASITGGVVTFIMPTSSGWSASNPAITWKAG